MEKVQLGRRDMMARASLALGGLVTLGSLPGCGSDSSSSTPTAATPVVADFPYDKHIPAGYQLDPAAVQEAAYHAYYNGGCCHGSFSALLSHLSATVGAPFNLLPIDLGKFGAGGIDGYGSICGSLLGADLIINMIVSDPAARKNLIWTLMRWYETYAFPSYVPVQVDAKELGKTTLSFTGGTPAMTKVAPGTHLCHGSVSKWCNANVVAATSADKLARCSRLTADVAGKVVELLNTYLAASPRAYGTIGVTDPNTKSTCDTCHTAASATPPSVSSDMTCVTCHPIATLPATHPAVTPLP